MLKTVVPLLIGAAPAAALTWTLVGSETDDSATAREVRISTATAVDVTAEPEPTRSNPALAAYGEAGRLADAAAVEAELAEAMAEPFSPERDARIEALFERLAALDIRRALRFAEAPGFNRNVFAGVFRAWAETDRDAALEAIGIIADPELRVTAALALLESFGDDAESIERIAAALPEFQRIDFQAEALARRAVVDPNAALNAALVMRDPAVRNTATQRIGTAWAREDPIAALARAATLPGELQSAYRDSVATEWARVDVPGFLAFADTQPTLDTLLTGMTQSMAVDPIALFEIASRHPPVPIGGGFPPNITVERTAFSAAVQRDPQWGLAYLETMPDDQRKASFRAAIAETWGRTDPSAAMAWARSLEPRQTQLEATVVWSAGLVDIDMAIDWMLNFQAETGQPPPPMVAGNLATFAGTDPRREEIATALRDRTDNSPQAAELLNRITGLWVQTDPAGALDWLLAGGSSIDPGLAANVAGRLATRDPELAASYLDRLPPELKGAWLQQVAVPYATRDPEAAAALIARYQNEPGYENVLQSVLQMSAQTDPQAASRMLLAAPASMQAGASQAVATAWVQRDLAGAARWAADLQNAEARLNAVNTVASAWANRDPQAAQRWALALPPGETRDRALAAIISRFMRPDFNVPVDQRLIDAIESDQIRQSLERMSQRPI